LAHASLESAHFLILVPQSIYMSLPNRVHRSISGVMDLNLLVTGGATALILAAVFALAYFGVRRYTRPLLHIADAARRLGEGDFSVRLDMRLKDERDQLVRALNDMGPRMEDHLRLRHALAVAEEVQRNLLPNTAPLLESFDIQGASIYCDETGGDYYDYIPFVQDGRTATAVVVGDVSGHGVSSALLMATARALLRCLCAVPGQGLTPALRVGLVNRLLCSDVAGTGRFMTLFLLELDEADSLVRWVRAGHDPALLYDPDADEFTLLEGDGVAMGVLPDYEYTTYGTELDASGLVLALGTDGIWEARDASGAMYGKHRFREVIRAHARKDAAEIFDAVIRSLHEFMDGASFEDDVTLVIVKRR
ncbi:MAG: PP2C family protein-serine/threonine phosphatase, partial [Oceanidesulfovibrio sp.]